MTDDCHAPARRTSSIDALFVETEARGDAWTFAIETDTEGPLDEGRLRTALHAATSATGARISLVEDTKGARAWRNATRLDEEPLSTDAASDWSVARRIPLHTSPPFRVLISPHGYGHRLRWLFNHAAADGAGAVSLIIATFASYRGDALQLAATDSAPEPSPSEGSTGWHPPRHGPPARLAPQGGGGSGIEEVFVSLDSGPLAAGLRTSGASVNDGLLAAMHIAIDRWNRDHGSPVKRVGVIVPINLRPPARRFADFLNQSALVSVSTLPPERSDLWHCLDAIQAQTERLRSDSARASFRALTERTATIPSWALIAMLDSIVLTNLGLITPIDSGDAGPVTDVRLVPSVRRPLYAAVGALGYAGRIQLALGYHRRIFDRGAASSFLASIRDQLHELSER